MTAAPQVSVNGQGVVPASQLNAYCFTAYNAAVLRTVVGQTGMSCVLQGVVAPGDSNQGLFYWSGSSTAPDDNLNVIVPNGVVQGAWLRLSLGEENPFANLPTTLPATPGVAWNNGGVVCIS